jgi:hypothetical protein
MERFANPFSVFRMLITLPDILLSNPAKLSEYRYIVQFWIAKRFGLESFI